ncbi:sn-glycerol-1-phosphate dehydrogenase [Propionicicella superfundia]|uniref:sn-glycerol-1-phosphate dehydrogenase n=1 Tax=Propionicicella superfundia TaxID=348582 RepID=UPI000417C579|nr:sn-glycerol-1-phosphate dehydrogenase [Propionicicella superfundia]
MPESLIDKALETATDTHAIEIGRGVVATTGRLFAERFPGRAGIIVADENHWRVAGRQVVESLTSAGVRLLDPYVFPGTPTLYAGYDNVETVREELRGKDAVPIAVASGTLNDIVKRACGELEIEYLCVATAASMDGYASYGASITKDGFKQTLTCPAPAVIVADLDIMAGAPERLTATGFGDLIEKVPAGADWIICDELGIEKIDPYVWSLVQGPLRESLADPQGCKDGDPEAISGLASGLVMSGLAMQAYQSSRPASGGGHHFSHLWEMEHYGLDWDPPLSHGFKVGLGTVSVAALYEVVLAADLASAIDVDAAVAAWPTWDETEAQLKAALTPDLHEPALAQTRGKYLGSDEVRARLELTIERWPVIEKRLREQLLPAAVLKEKLDTVGAVTHPSQIGMPMDRFRDTYHRARWIRTRFVLTDLLTQANLLDPFVDELFAPGGFWAEQ